MKDLVKKICEKMGKHELIRFGDVPTSPSDPQELVANINQLTKNAEWTPTYDLDAGIEKTIHWWQKRFMSSIS